MSKSMKQLDEENKILKDQVEQLKGLWKDLVITQLPFGAPGGKVEIIRVIVDKTTFGMLQNFHTLLDAVQNAEQIDPPAKDNNNNEDDENAMVREETNINKITTD